MADIIKCPVCGENNSANIEFCQYCQTRLQPLTGPLKGIDETLKPGQMPTKKDTGDLEPILPQWLRDVRSSAQQNSEGDTAQPIQRTQDSRPASFGGDLLAGLHATHQSQDSEEDVPDWLTNITGETSKQKKSQPQSSEVRWVELGGKNDFAQGQKEPASDALPWLSGSNPSTPQPGEKDELTDWFRDASNTPKPPQPDQTSSAKDNSFFAAPVGDTPDWLRAMATENGAQDDNKLSNDLDNIFNSASASSDTPDWLRSMSAEDGAQNDSSASSGLNNIFDSAPASSDTPDWLRSMSAEDGAQNDSSASSGLNNIFDSAPTSSDTPDWLRSMSAEDGAQNDVAASSGLNNIFDSAPASSDTPDWLRSMSAEDGAQNDGAASSGLNNIFGSAPASSDAPDWLRSMSAENGAQNEAPASSDALDWLRQDQTQSADSAVFSETGFGESEAVEGSPAGAGGVSDWLSGLDSETPIATSSSDQDWMKNLQAGESEQPAQVHDETPAWLKADVPTEDVEIPVWLSGAPTSEPAKHEQKQPPVAAPEPDASAVEFGDVPSWLKAAAPQSSIFGEPSVERGTPASIVPSSDTPDWLNTFKSGDAKPVSAFSMDTPVESTPPVFIDNSQAGESTEALFTDMPDWLSNVDDSPASSAPTAITNADAIAPSDLPSWVQAMRPVDTGMPQSSSSSLSSDQTLESRGALAGLQGVLPAASGFNPTSKPKTYSIKLQASEEQQAHAALLEQILAAETEPVPLTSFSALATSRVLRWLIAVVLFVSVTAVLILRTQIFVMPNGAFIPLEIGDALQVSQSIPDDAPVLVAFDYEPGRAGEMEAAAAPMFDQMLLLNHPHLTFISTSETGAILAERFISGPLAGHNYQSGIQYLNLGYLPGGQMGIYTFAQNPKATSEFAFNRNPATATLFDLSSLTPAWTSEPWSGITSLSQFAALVIVTDNADSAREWIEQTTTARGAIPIVVISSAQAAPMIRPYYDSRQISGLVSGLYGGAVYEQNNANRPGTARLYWDAYSIGMLLAAVLILGGGLWNLVLGARDRAAAREAK